MSIVYQNAVFKNLSQRQNLDLFFAYFHYEK